MASLILLLVLSLAQQDTVFHSGVALVRVDAEAADSAGNILTDLKKEDFRVFDEGVEQKPVEFSFEKEPLDLILLFDTSHSMTSKIHQILRAVELGFHELQPGDRVCVMTFAGIAAEIAPFTGNMDNVNETILLKVLTSKFSGSANLGAAASTAAARFKSEPITQRRRAVLVIGDRASGRAETVVHDLWESNAVLSQLVPEKPGANKVLPHGENLIADQTGGSTIIAGDPGPAFQDSLRRLRRRYTIYYSLPAAAPGSERHIEVRVANAIVQARSGYIVPR